MNQPPRKPPKRSSKEPFPSLFSHAEMYRVLGAEVAQSADLRAQLDAATAPVRNPLSRAPRAACARLPVAWARINEVLVLPALLSYVRRANYAHHTAHYLRHVGTQVHWNSWSQSPRALQLREQYATAAAERGERSPSIVASTELRREYGRICAAAKAEMRRAWGTANLPGKSPRDPRGRPKTRAFAVEAPQLIGALDHLLGEFLQALPREAIYAAAETALLRSFLPGTHAPQRKLIVDLAIQLIDNLLDATNNAQKDNHSAATRQEEFIAAIFACEVEGQQLFESSTLFGAGGVTSQKARELSAALRNSGAGGADTM